MKLGAVTPREGILLALVGILVLAVLFTNCVLIPLRDQLSSTREQLTQAQELQSRYQVMLSQEDDLIAEYRALISGGASNRTDVLTAVDLVSEVHKMASNQIEFRSIRPSEQQISTEGGKLLAVDLDCTSRFDQLVRFMYNIEKTNSGLAIRNLEFSVSSTRTDSVNVHLRLERVLR